MPWKWNPFTGTLDITTAASAVGAGAPVTETIVSGTGTVFTLSAAYPPDGTYVYLNGLLQKRVASAPGIGEYTLSGTTITFGLAIDATDDWAFVESWFASAPLSEVPAGSLPGTAFTTANLYTIANLYLNGVLQRPRGMAPGINEYVLSGTSLTMGQTVDSTDWFFLSGWA